MAIAEFKPLEREILSLTQTISGQDIVNLVALTGKTDRGVKMTLGRLVKRGSLRESAGHYSSHPALTI